MFNIDAKTVKELRDYAREQGHKIPGMRVMVKAELYSRIFELEEQQAIDNEPNYNDTQDTTNEQVKSINVEDYQPAAISPTGQDDEQPGAADYGHSPSTNDLITLVTTAPKAYDGFSVTEVDSQAGIDNRGKTFRKVTVEPRDRDWYEGRVASGLHAITTEAEARRFPTIWRFIEHTDTETQEDAPTVVAPSPPQEAPESCDLSPTCQVNCKPDGRITRASNWFDVFKLAKQGDPRVKAVPGEERGVKFTAYYLMPRKPRQTCSGDSPSVSSDTDR